MMNSTELTNHDAPSKKVRRTEEKSVRRLQLIKATIASIAKHGFSGTTVAKVTEIAGLSLGFVNFHFGSKERLLEATLSFLAMEHREQWQLEVRDPHLSDVDRLLRIVDSHFHPRICSRKKLAVWFAFFGEAGNRSVYRKIVVDIDDERLFETIRLCHELKEAGGYANIDPRHVALTLEGMFDGLWLNILIYPSEFNADVSKKQIRTFLAAIFPRHFGGSIPSHEGTL